MKNTFLRLAGAVLLALAVSTAAKADPITGTIQFSGLVTFNTGSPATATSATFSNVSVLIASGDFSSTIGQTTTFVTPWTFSSTGVDLWSVAGFTFHLQSSTILPGGTGVDPINNQPWIQITSQGTITSTNSAYDETYGVFNFSSEGPGTVGYFSFSGHTTADGQGVPDGGTTALLVGLGLIGMSVVARRRK